jgi:uncharacterized protein YndB with AHSA1/START domain
MTERTVTHATFVIERTYDAPPPRVFAAFASAPAKSRWFHGPDEWPTGQHELDFRVGGREATSGGPKDGPLHHFESTFQDIVPNERIINSYRMRLGETPISVSLATVELKPAGAGTRLTYTEYGAYLDGWDNPQLREQGTRDLLDQLGAVLQLQMSGA